MLSFNKTRTQLKHFLVLCVFFNISACFVKLFTYVYNENYRKIPFSADSLHYVGILHQMGQILVSDKI